MKFLNRLLLVLVLFLFNISLSYASSISNVTIIDESNLKFDISRDVILSEGNLDAEIKVMKDINVSFISKDFEDKNKLILNLSSDIKENSLYSLITILGPEGNMDFETGLSIQDQEILNSEKTEATKQGIIRLLIVNSRTIELYYNNIIEEEELEFKIFNELNIKEINYNGENDIKINLVDKFEKVSNYILMILSISDTYGNYVSLDEDLFEILTTKDLKNSETDEEEIEVEVEVEENSVEDFALNSAETPDTGPETTVLIILTFIVNLIFIFRKKILK